MVYSHFRDVVSGGFNIGDRGKNRNLEQFCGSLEQDRHAINMPTDPCVGASSDAKRISGIKMYSCAIEDAGTSTEG